MNIEWLYRREYMSKDENIKDFLEIFNLKSLYQLYLYFFNSIYVMICVAIFKLSTTVYVIDIILIWNWYLNHYLYLFQGHVYEQDFRVELFCKYSFIIIIITIAIIIMIIYRFIVNIWMMIGNLFDCSYI